MSSAAGSCLPATGECNCSPGYTGASCGVCDTLAGYADFTVGDQNACTETPVPTQASPLPSPLTPAAPKPPAPSAGADPIPPAPPLPPPLVPPTSVGGLFAQSEDSLSDGAVTGIAMGALVGLVALFAGVLAVSRTRARQQSFAGLRTASTAVPLVFEDPASQASAARMFEDPTSQASTACEFEDPDDPPSQASAARVSEGPASQASAAGVFQDAEDRPTQSSADSERETLGYFAALPM